ncbi:hypothetical protein ebA4925 [Aromatoleum aromaticum EbN1]|uniref:Uncharacterized protein n=1 Tax=Aromatoleum aromaticum (strain DSM 19018 / LMG 30748 / EbN1) TaxID=76114 RepID=Q5P187_AROAE|nr:hypothetical protein ebA4925 [Aromatoleum aromaticum EbN1]
MSQSFKSSSRSRRKVAALTVQHCAKSAPLSRATQHFRQTSHPLITVLFRAPSRGNAGIFG